VIADTDATLGAQAVAEVDPTGAAAMFQPCDVTDEAQIEELMSAVAERSVRVRLGDVRASG